ncbi:hypothetical protein [Staphylococcus borealis]|uniref:hypothetical protein n=1 Tax=Staphylococcus borealis TaxID=2742203 RepID=UPI00211C3C33|nr:hypothetical protein [Staphylococcus borealis]MCQ9279780.1 hypothetical protein [Staphylococcus borealis]
MKRRDQFREISFIEKLKFNRRKEIHKKKLSKELSVKDISIKYNFQIHTLILLILMSLLMILVCLTCKEALAITFISIVYVFFILHLIYNLCLRKKVDLNNVSYVQYYLLELALFLSLFIYIATATILFGVLSLDLASENIFDYITACSFIILVFLEGAVPYTIKKGVHNKHYIIDENHQNDVDKLYKNYKIINLVGLLLIAFFITFITLIKFLNDYFINF